MRNKEMDIESEQRGGLEINVEIEIDAVHLFFFIRTSKSHLRRGKR